MSPKEAVRLVEALGVFVEAADSHHPMYHPTDMFPACRNVTRERLERAWATWERLNKRAQMGVEGAHEL